MANERRRTRAPVVTVAALGVLTAAVLAAIALWGSESEATLTPTPSFHVDIGSSFLPTSTDNSYVEDPNSDNNASDQLMSITTPITRCVQRTVTDFTSVLQTQIVTDIIIQNAQEMVGGDVRINFDPSLIQVFTTNITPFPGGGFTGQPVGLINLPVEPFAGGTHRTASPGINADNTNGAVFVAGVYQGLPEFDVSSESGPSVDSATNSLPDRNAGQAPDGGVFVRIIWRLQAASDGQDVLIDLTTAGLSFTGGGVITGGSGFVTLLTEDDLSTPAIDPTIEIITLGNPNLFDGVVSVNKAIPSPCPPPPPAFHDVEAEGIAGTRGSTIKLFKGCLGKEDPCTATQNHHLLVVNNSDHTEDIRVLYQVVGWPLASSGCTVNGVFSPGLGGLITVNDTVEIAVPANALRNIKVTVTYSCPANQVGLIGTPVQLRLEVGHQRDGFRSGDDDASNDIFTKGKIIN